MERDVTRGSLAGQPGSPPLPAPVSNQEPAKSESPPEKVVDEITAWWQKALGTKAVLGQASNRPSLDQRAPLPELLWTKPDNGHAQQERNVVEVIPSVIDKKGMRASSSRSLSTLGRLKQWPGVIIIGTMFFLAVMFLRSVVAVFETLRWARGILTVEFSRVKRWSHGTTGLVAASASTAGKA